MWFIKFFFLFNKTTHKEFQALVNFKRVPTSSFTLPGIRSLFFFFFQATYSSVCSISFSFFSSEMHGLSCLSSFSLLGFDFTYKPLQAVKPSLVFTKDDVDPAKEVTACWGFGATTWTLILGCCRDAMGWSRTVGDVDATKWVLTVPCVVVTGRVLEAVCERISAWTVGIVLTLELTLWVCITVVPGFDIFLFSTNEFSILPGLLSKEGLEQVTLGTVTLVWFLSVKCGLIINTLLLLLLLLLLLTFSMSLSLVLLADITFWIGVVLEHSVMFPFRCLWLDCSGCEVRTTSLLITLEGIRGGGTFGFSPLDGGMSWAAALVISAVSALSGIVTCTLGLTNGGGPILWTFRPTWGGAFVLSNTPSDMSDPVLSSSSDSLHLFAAGELVRWFWMSATNRFFLRTLFCAALSFFFFLGLPFRTGAGGGKKKQYYSICLLCLSHIFLLVLEMSQVIKELTKGQVTLQTNFQFGWI